MRLLRHACLAIACLAMVMMSAATPLHAQRGGTGVAANLFAAPLNGGAARYTDTTGQTLSSAAVTVNTFVQIIVGQSLGGAHVQGNYVATQDCRAVNLSGDRKVYLDNTGNEEMGATYSPRGYQAWSIYSSMWPKLCDLLIAGGKFDRVITINASSAGEPIARFMPSGGLGYLLPLAFQTLNELGIKPSRVNAIIAMEGESDGINGTSQAAYQSAMQTWFTVAANFGFVGKWIVPLETYAYGCTSATIRAAQAAVVGGNVIQGPDFDTLVGATNRYAESAAGGCATNALVHPNATGRDAMMALLKATIYANF